MTLGTQDKAKVVALVGLGLVAAYLFYTNVLADSGGGPAPQASERKSSTETPGGALVPAAPSSTPALPRGRASSRSRGDDFHPVLHSAREEDRIDPMTIDPTLRLDLLAKLQQEPNIGGVRNLFQFGPAPAPKAELPKGPEPKIMPAVFVGPRQAPAQEAVSRVPVEPPPPPITIKYYGYANARGNGRKTAFFLDGEDILVAGEGDLVKRRYKVVSIGVKSVVVEDTLSKRQQPVPLADEAPGA